MKNLSSKFCSPLSELSESERKSALSHFVEELFCFEKKRFLPLYSRTTKNFKKQKNLVEKFFELYPMVKTVWFYLLAL